MRKSFIRTALFSVLLFSSVAISEASGLQLIEDMDAPITEHLESAVVVTGVYNSKIDKRENTKTGDKSDKKIEGKKENDQNKVKEDVEVNPEVVQEQQEAYIEEEPIIEEVVGQEVYSAPEEVPEPSQPIQQVDTSNSINGVSFFYGGQIFGDGIDFGDPSSPYYMQEGLYMWTGMENFPVNNWYLTDFLTNIGKATLNLSAGDTFYIHGEQKVVSNVLYGFANQPYTADYLAGLQASYGTNVIQVCETTDSLSTLRLVFFY